MYHTVRYIVNKGNPLHQYFENLSHLANNLHNAALFRIRQVLSGVKKTTLTQNEQEVMDEIKGALPIMNATRIKANSKRKMPSPPFEMPTASASFISYPFLDALMKATGNSDYYAPLPRQTAQLVMKEARGDVKNYFAALRAYKKNPEAFQSKPKMPHYRKSGGVRNIPFTNQDCVIRDTTLKFPGTKNTLALGGVIPNNAKLKQVEVRPYYGKFQVCVVYDDMIPGKQKSFRQPERIIAIDFGVDNIAAIANNISESGLLFKGGIVKSANQWFNKRRAEIVSAITAGAPTNYCPASRSLHRLSMWRDGLLSTELHTYAKKIVAKCVEWNIDTIVLGVNKGWKQESNIGRENNQSFVNIPHHKLQQYITYMAEWEGIQVVEQEESYTSKASFLDNDFIPVYGNSGATEAKFSGYRIKRGLYKLKSRKVWVNADLNGAGNILRKAFPNAFDGKGQRFLEEIIVM